MDRGNVMSDTTHGLRIDFGKHKGELWTRVPVSYLKWLANTAAADPTSNLTKAANIAKLELTRRGTVTPDIDISGHAIDRASLNCRKIWHETRKPDEGLHAWLVRVTREAIDKDEKDAAGRFLHLGMKFAVEQDGCWPVLVTVMRSD